jgi:hypothetical protein
MNKSMNKSINKSMNKSINKPINKLLKNLPKEIINIIIQYTYELQPIELRKDIISFYITKNIVKNIFIYRNYTLYYIKHVLFQLHGFLMEFQIFTLIVTIK